VQDSVIYIFSLGPLLIDFQSGNNNSEKKLFSGQMDMPMAGALLQLAFLKQLEESSRSEIDIFHQMDQDSSLNKTTGFPSVYSIWKNDEDARILRIGMVKQEMLNWQPRIILFHNFLSADECDHLINLARPKLAKSTVVDTNTGKGIESKVRTSTGMFLTFVDRKHKVIEAIETRISVYSMIPVENGELLQVLRYVLGTGECLLYICSIFESLQVECCCSHQIDLNGCAGMNLASTTKHIMTILLMRYFLHQTYPCLTSWTLQSEKKIVTTALSQLLILFVSVQLKERWAESCHHAHVSIRWCGRW
jgi:hypothetical protein